MSGISQSPAVAEARHALFNAIKVALEGEAVDIAFGFRWPFSQNDWFQLTNFDADLDLVDIGPGRQQEETVTFHASVGSWTPGHDEASEIRAFDRAFSLLTKVQDHIRQNDITLGNTVLWCVPGSFASDGATTDQDSVQGRLIEIDASFVCAHRIRTTT